MEAIHDKRTHEERTQQENDELYISCSKQNIDKFIHKNDYMRAFALLLCVLDRLDDGKQKNDFITHYLNSTFEKRFIQIDCHLNPR